MLTKEIIALFDNFIRLFTTCNSSHKFISLHFIKTSLCARSDSGSCHTTEK